MKKLSLKNVQEAGNFPKVQPGGYVCIIKGIEDVVDREYLRVSYDIADGEHKGIYTKRQKETGWDLPTFIQSYSEKSLPFFKGFVTSVEQTNKGFKWDEEHEQQFVNKGIGLVLANEHYLNKKGEEKIRLIAIAKHSADAIRKGDFEPPIEEYANNMQSVEPKEDNPFAKVAVAEESDSAFAFEPDTAETEVVAEQPTDDACPF